jgi:hypothetical protein
VELFCSSFLEVPPFVIQFLVNFVLPRQPAWLRQGRSLYTQHRERERARERERNRVCSLLPASWCDFIVTIPYIDHACLQSISGDVCMPVQATYVCLWLSLFDVVISGFDECRKVELLVR